MLRSGGNVHPRKEVPALNSEIKMLRSLPDEKLVDRVRHADYRRLETLRVIESHHRRIAELKRFLDENRNNEGVREEACQELALEQARFEEAVATEARYRNCLASLSAEYRRRQAIARRQDTLGIVEHLLRTINSSGSPCLALERSVLLSIKGKLLFALHCEKAMSE